MGKHYFIMPPKTRENNSDGYWVISKGSWVLYLSNRIGDYQCTEVDTMAEAEALVAKLDARFDELKKAALDKNKCSSPN